MKQSRFFLVATLLILLTSPLLWWVWQNQSNASANEIVEANVLAQQSLLPTLALDVATVPASSTPIPTLPPTFTPHPTVPATFTPLPTETPTITPTPLPTEAPTETPTITPEFVTDRTCQYPAQPAYTRYQLAQNPLPTPSPLAQAHFWLTKPFAGGGRVLASDVLPYGNDGGAGRYLLHNGSDFSGGLGTPLIAVADGTVVVAQSDAEELYGWRCNWYGHLVVIELDVRWQNKPIYVLYGHVLNIKVEAGDRVVNGQQVAEVGYGGAAITPHLHFEVRVGENNFESSRNPLLWIYPGSTRGVIAGRLVDGIGRPWLGYPVYVKGISEDTSEKTVWTYLGDPDNLINPDEAFAENFVAADLKPGEYQLAVEVQGTIYSTTVTVEAGQVAMAEIRTVPPTATPSPTPTP